LLAIEQLHDAHARNVFLQERVDSCDSGANVAIGIAHIVAKDEGDDENQRKDREGIESETRIHPEQQASHHRKQEEIIDHGHNAGGEKVVEGVDVGGDPSDQATHRVVVEVTHGQALEMAEDFGAHVVHGLLADTLHDADLNVLGDKIEDQNEQIEDAEDRYATNGAIFRQKALQRRREVAINGNLKDARGASSNGVTMATRAMASTTRHLYGRMYCINRRIRRES